LVGAALRHPESAICYAQVQWTGLQAYIERGVPLSGPPIERVLTYLKFMDCSAFRGLIRSSAIAATSGLLLSDFDPFDSYGTEVRFLAQLSLLGEFHFVPGPTYYKNVHGANLYLKREKWSEHQKQLAWACLAAWMAEVVVPAGRTPEARKRLFDAVLIRFLVPSNPWKWPKAVTRRLARTDSRLLHPARMTVGWLKNNDVIERAVRERWLLYETRSPEDRAALLRLIFVRLKNAGQFNPSVQLQSTWENLEHEAKLMLMGAANLSENGL
jgi:hypothetical protein